MTEQRDPQGARTGQTSRVKDGGIPISTRKPREIRVLAERNPPVVAVGAWVETGAWRQEHPAVRARITEEIHEEERREKEESLQRFQETVRRRVSQHAQLRKQQKLQRSYEMAEREYRMVQQSNNAAQRLTPQMSVFPSWPQEELAICSPNSCSARAQESEILSTDNTHQYTHKLIKVMKQVRHRLAACQTVRDGKELSELPGGVWKKPVSHARRVPENDEEVEQQQENENGLGEEEEISLAEQHDRPLHSGKTVSFQNDLLLKEPYLTSIKSQVLWPGRDEEELKRQKQSQFIMYRRLFMDIEREQVKEHQQHRKHLRRIARIKAEKERRRKEEESRMERAKQQEESRREVAEMECLILEQLRLETKDHDEEVKKRERAKKAKETNRYIEALRVQMKEKLEQEKVELPPLCCCGDSFWDSHPNTCANNCVFYNNPKGYAKALHAVLLSCAQNEGSTGDRGTTWKIASMQARSPRK